MIVGFGDPQRRQSRVPHPTQEGFEIGHLPETLVEARYRFGAAPRHRPPAMAWHDAGPSQGLPRADLATGCRSRIPLSTALRGAACALVVTMGMPARSTDCISEHRS